MTDHTQQPEQPYDAPVPDPYGRFGTNRGDVHADPADTPADTSVEVDTRPTGDEVNESLTGVDEIAIEKAFGKSPELLTGNMPARALVFVLERRAGLNDRDAYRLVMDTPVKAIVARFAEDDDLEPDLADGDPTSESGKGAQLPG